MLNRYSVEKDENTTKLGHYETVCETASFGSALSLYKQTVKEAGGKYAVLLIDNFESCELKCEPRTY
jgi:hypothetical protein